MFIVQRAFARDHLSSLKSVYLYSKNSNRMTCERIIFFRSLRVYYQAEVISKDVSLPGDSNYITVKYDAIHRRH